MDFKDPMSRSIATSHRRDFASRRGALRDLLAWSIGARKHVFYVLVAYVSVIFLCGGGARSDIQSLILVRPLAVLVCGFALLTLRLDDLRRYRFMSVMAILVILLLLAHMIPLPPSMWQALPGRDLVVDIDRAAGLSNLWRPLTLTPQAAENAFFSVFVPLGAFLLAVQLDLDDRRRLVVPLLVIAGLSGLLGIFQIVGDPKGSLYLYRITNNGQAVGLFSNRNHQAVFLVAMFPLLAYFASQALRTDDQIKTRLVICTAAAAILVPLVLVTGSRQGLLLGLLAIALSFLIFQRPQASLARRRGEQKSFGMMFVTIFAALLLAVVTAVASRAEALNRLIATDLNEEGRATAWRIVAKLISEYFPLGSGSGSFVEAYQVAEPLSELRPNYFNHAHNDFLEVALTFGLPGMLLLVVAVAGFARGAWIIFRLKPSEQKGNRLARSGAVIVLTAGLASFVDYPLRTPSFACFFVIACCLMYSGLPSQRNSAGVAMTG